MSTIIALIATFSFLGVQSALPPGFLVCKTSDEACLTKAVESALKFIATENVLKLDKAEPFVVEKVHIPGNGGKVDLDQTYTNLEIHGATNSKVVSANVNLEDGNCRIVLETFSPNVILKGDYTFKGKMLLFQLNGVGKTKITIHNLKATNEMPCEVVTRKGKNHVHLTDYKFTMHPEKIIYEFENLVDGNAQLSEEINKVMNDNDLEVFEAIKADYGVTFGGIFKHIANQLLTKLTKEELFL